MPATKKVTTAFVHSYVLALCFTQQLMRASSQALPTDEVQLLQYEATVAACNAGSASCDVQSQVFNKSLGPFEASEFHGVSLALRSILQLLTCAIIVIRLCRWCCVTDTKQDFKSGLATPASSTQTTAPVEQSRAVGARDLREAIHADDLSRCKMLLQEEGHCACGVDSWGCSHLHQASLSASPAVLELLLSKGAKVNLADAMEETPLHYAARAGRLKACQLLLDHGAEANAQSLQETPLLVAGRAGHQDVCELLLARGARAGGVADEDLPPLLSVLLVQRCLLPETVD